MNPEAGPKVLSKSEAAFQRVAGRAMKEQAPSTQERVPAPLTSPANSEDEGMSEDQRRQVEKAKRMAARSAQKAAAPPRAPAEQLKGAKAPPLTKGQESSETKVSHPMGTRKRKASRAGGLRSGGGSGQTEIGVLQGATPSKT
jgi:hypothetical protein